MSGQLGDSSAADDGFYCIHCGSRMGRGAHFCPNCGRPASRRAVLESSQLRKILTATALTLISFLIGLPLGLVSYTFVHRVAVKVPHNGGPIDEVGDPILAVESFYDDLNKRSFSEAFGLLSRSEQQGRSLQTWEAGYSSTLAQRAVVTRATSTAFAVDLQANDRDPDGTITSIYKGTWSTVFQRGRWHLQDPNFRKVTTSYFVAGPRDQSISDVYARLKHSLALIANENSDGVMTGSAFCIASNAQASYFLTNHHVIGDEGPIKVVVYGQRSAFDGQVVSVADPPLDAAVIAIKVGALPVLPLANSLPQEGRLIAVAGYPSIQVELALQDLGLSPSLHGGTVNAIADGKMIEYDAETDHGNSGGPLFDAATGQVYGIVTWGLQSPASSAVQNNFAQSIPSLKSFIDSTGITPLNI